MAPTEAPRGAARGATRASSKKAAVRKDSARRGAAAQQKKVPISDLLKVGDQVIQVTKDAIRGQGAHPHHLHLDPRPVPGAHAHWREQEDPRRQGAPPPQARPPGHEVPDGMGVIVRTAGVGRKKGDLQRDLDYLMGVWESFGKRLKHSPRPSALYEESDLAIRTLQDLFGGERTAKVVVDDVMVHEQMLEFAEQLVPEQKHRIVMHDGDRPVFTTSASSRSSSRSSPASWTSPPAAPWSSTCRPRPWWPSTSTRTNPDRQPRLREDRAEDQPRGRARDRSPDPGCRTSAGSS